MWCSKEYYYEIDFLREELVGFGGYFCCNEYIFVFMNIVIDVFLIILLGKKVLLDSICLTERFFRLVFEGLICSLF